MTKGKDTAPDYRDIWLVKSNQSCMKNTTQWMTYGAILGTGAGVTIAQNHLHLSALEHAGRAIARCIFPSVLIGGMFASTTCMMDEWRGPQTPISNGFIGGAVAGVVLGTRQHNPGKLVYYGFLLGLLGAAARFCAVDGLSSYNAKKEFELLDKSIIMAEIRHLDPYASQK